MATITTTTKTELERLFEAAKAACTQLNALRALEQKTAEDFENIEKIPADIDEIVKKYNAEAYKVLANELRADKHPMAKAIETLTYECIKFTDKEDKELNMVNASIDTVDRPIDILRFYKDSGKPGANSIWASELEQLHMLFIAKVFNKLELDPSKVSNYKCLYMNKVAASIGTEAVMFSNTGLLRKSRQVFSDMLGDKYPDMKTISKDINYMYLLVAKENRRSKYGVQIMDKRHFAMMFARVANRVINNGKYSADCKEIKVDESAK